ncbi:PQQ-binding-like beta-propeller repeat protein [Deinococcus radiomollis]|uniref:protein kinase domain-containing protein n=1 Tax=Deinococcus radiomollis TaxID=468916 RepID=UPI0038925DE5
MEAERDMTGTLLAGRYEVGELLGEGGSARVYRAADRQLGREVAVKVVHEHLPPADRQRFLREIRTLARLTHPGVVTVYDLGEQGGRVFFTMPLLVGGPISSLGPLEDDPAQLGRFLEAAAFVARALQHVHDSGLVHRDLTPGNILLDASGVPRIMDFGLVALSEYTRQLTRSGVTLGTPQYMAPEQARGVGVGPSSDLYALGAVLYRVACGSPPFVGDSDQSILYQHVYDAPPDPRELNPAVPDGLAQVLLSLLAKTPVGRPESGEALARQLGLAHRDAWAMSGRSQYRGGRNRGGEQHDGPLGAARLQPVWSIRLPGEVTWPSAVLGQNGLLAVGVRSGRLCLVSSSGQLQGQLQAGDEVTAPATFHGESVLYGAWDGLLRRSSFTGVQRWSHRTRAEITGAPTVWGGRVLSSSRDGHLHAVNLETGVLEWAYRAAGPIAATPLIWGGAAMIADEEGWVHALDASTGAQLWKVQLQTVHATPALAHLGRGEAALLVGCWPGEVHALHLSVQQGHARPHPGDPLLWTYDLEDELWAAPAVSGETVILAGWGGRVRAVTLRGGDDLWDRKLAGRITASPVIAGGLVYLASEAGELCALSLRSGEVVWQTQEPVGLQATPLVSAGTLYVALMDGTLRAYRNPDER